MKKLSCAGVFAALALSGPAVPALLSAQKSPAISEVVVTKVTDGTSSNLFRKAPNARLYARRANGDEFGPIGAYVDPDLLRQAQFGANGTGKTLAAEVMASRLGGGQLLLSAANTYSSSWSMLSNAAKKQEQWTSMTVVMADGSVRSADAKPYLQFKLRPVFVKSWSTSTGDRPTESVSINFTKIEFKNTPYNDQHKG